MRDTYGIELVTDTIAFLLAMSVLVLVMQNGKAVNAFIRNGGIDRNLTEVNAEIDTLYEHPELVYSRSETARIMANDLADGYVVYIGNRKYTGGEDYYSVYSNLSNTNYQREYKLGTDGNIVMIKYTRVN